MSSMDRNENDTADVAANVEANQPQAHEEAQEPAESDVEGGQQMDNNSSSDGDSDADGNLQDIAEERRLALFANGLLVFGRARRRRRGDDWMDRQVDRMDLRDFLRLFAVAAAPQEDAFTTNEELVQHLVDDRYIRSDNVQKAMLACPRRVFIPPAHELDAYVDNPIRVESFQFNISAPHMHASALEALDIQPGERILDVGCGCGAVSALVAYLTGKAGEVVGIDIKPECIELSSQAVSHLLDNSSDFSSTAASIQFHLHNVFMPCLGHMGQYDKVHVGATCPEINLPSLISLLKPEGGKIVVPVSNDLRLITKKMDKINQEVLLQVRFSDLEVPTDAEILMATLQMEITRQRSVQVPASTFSQDLASLAHSPMADDSSTSGASDQTAYDEEWGPADCAFTAPGYQIPAHKEVLRARCELFRAKFSSGMKDADSCELRVPDSFQQEVFSAFLQYIYKDTPPQQLDLDAEKTLHLLHIATYYGASRLVVLCEAHLAQELTESEHSVACESACSLLAAADENGLQQLKAVALSFIAENYEEVSKTEAYQSLTRRQVDMVADACFKQTRYLHSLLQELKNKPTLPPPGLSSRARWRL